MDHDSEEKGLPPAGTTNQEASSSALKGSGTPGAGDTAVPPTPEEAPTSKLAEFRNLIGIESAPDLTKKSTPPRPAPNIGIYNRTVSQEASSARWYTFWLFLTDFCLGLQIIIAAALTALGACGHTERAAITILGAINTAIAGLLTYIRGTGLPIRLRYYRSEWTKVREYIEQRERDFAEKNCDLDVAQEVATIEKMYETVRANV